jgi:hypothetical protein
LVNTTTSEVGAAAAPCATAVALWAIKPVIRQKAIKLQIRLGLWVDVQNVLILLK